MHAHQEIQLKYLKEHKSSAEYKMRTQTTAIPTFIGKGIRGSLHLVRIFYFRNSKTRCCLKIYGKLRTKEISSTGASSGYCQSQHAVFYLNKICFCLKLKILVANEGVLRFGKDIGDQSRVWTFSLFSNRRELWARDIWDIRGTNWMLF